VNTANYLTLLRILLGPIFLIIYKEHTFFGIDLIALPYVLLILLGLAELSDICDGYFARKYNEVTDIGKILDPMVDSIYRISIFLTFTIPPINLPMWVVFVFFYRDSVISILRIMCALKGMALAARPSGKVKAIMQGIAINAISFLLIPYSLNILALKHLQNISYFIALTTAIYTVFSGLDYILAHRAHLAELFGKVKPRETTF